MSVTDHQPSADQRNVMRFSLGIAGVLLVVKVAAAAITGSSAIYSDAAESVTHVLAVAFAAWALRYSHKPSDETHHFGHDKVAFISSGFEGAMISAAALLIWYEAGRQVLEGVKIEEVGLGLALTGFAALVNLVLGWSLVRVGKRRHSQLIRANGEHVLADVWTSAAVIVALVLMKWTGWVWWDPVCAVLAGGKLLWTGSRLMRESVGGLMDEADLAVEGRLRDLLDAECGQRGLTYHNLRQRHSGRTHWVELHLVFPDEEDVKAAHEVATEIEGRISDLLDGDARVITHLEPRSAEEEEQEWEAK